MMEKIGRRRLMASAGALSVLGSVPARAATPAPPVAKTGTATDVYFGETVSDPYRWMENAHDPDWLPYLKAQNDHARAVLDAIPGRAGLASHVAHLSGDTALTAKVQREAGKLFYQQRPAGADNFKLFVREGGHDRVLLDPTSMGGTTGHVSLDWWKSSPGRHARRLRRLSQRQRGQHAAHPGNRRRARLAGAHRQYSV